MRRTPHRLRSDRPAIHRRDRQVAAMMTPMPDLTEPPILSRFRALGAFYGAGRKLTSTGQPTLADARQLIEALGLPDRLEERYGNRVVTVRSAVELRELSFSIAWALRAGALRKLHGKLTATATWAKATEEERRRRALQTLVDAGPQQLRHPRSWPSFAALHELVDQAFPSLLMRIADGPLLLDEAAGELTEHLESGWRFSGPWATEGEVARFCRRALAETAHILELAGLVRLEAAAGGGDRRAGDGGAVGGVHGAPGDPQHLALRVGEQDDVPPGARLVPLNGAPELIERLELAATAPRVYRPGVAPSPRVHELRITLEGIDPPVWRQIVVPSGLSLAALHEVLQVVIGWEDCHLHCFEIAGATYGADDGEDWGTTILDERRHRLDHLVASGERFGYLYDFGDDWQHRVEVLDVRPAGDEVAPRLVGGERACPPEDSGGTRRYAWLLEVLANPRHREHESARTWVGEGFDPQRFDATAARARLWRLAGEAAPAGEGPRDGEGPRLGVVRD